MMFGLSRAAYAQNAHKVYINEIRANDTSGDDIEFIELIGPAGTNITGFYTIHYNGSSSQDGGLWTHTIGAFTIPNDGVTDSDGNNVGFYVLGPASGVNNVDESTNWSDNRIQNGPDGIILFDSDDNIIDAVAWEGAGDLTGDDPGTVSTSVSTTADNYLHVTTDDDSGDNSLQAPDNVLGDDGSGWTLATATPGAINSGQTSGDISLPVELTSITATPLKGAVILSWVTESEIDNLGFLIDRSLYPNSGFITIADYRFVPELEGQGSVTYRTDYSYNDGEVVPGTKYYYVLSDVTGNPEYGEPVTRHTEKMVSATPKWQEMSSALINGFRTFKAYPNPFNPKTVIAYELEDVRKLSVSIVDIYGRQVTELYHGSQASGFHELTWQPKDISAGIYFCHLTSGGNTITRKLVLLK